MLRSHESIAPFSSLSKYQVKPVKKVKRDSQGISIREYQQLRQNLKNYGNVFARLHSQANLSYRQIRNFKVTLDLSKLSLYSLNFMRHLPTTRVSSLNLNHNNLTSLRQLRKCDLTELRQLYLRGNKLKDNEPFHEFHFPNITHIFLNSNILIFMHTYKMKENCPKLVQICLQQNPIHPKLALRRDEKIKI